LAKQVWKALETSSDSGWEFYQELTVDDLRGLPATAEWYDAWMRMCDGLDEDGDDPLDQEETEAAQAGGIGRKRPDAWAVRWSAAKLYILEFTRPNDARPGWELTTDAYKQDRYEHVRSRIQQGLPGWSVEILTFTLGIRGSYNEASWCRNLGAFGISEPDRKKLMYDLVSLSLDQLCDIYQTRQSALHKQSH
jgi:hypothetical protein